MNIKWIRIAQLHESLKQRKISDQANLTLYIANSRGRNIVRTVAFVDFLAAMWDLFDSPYMVIRLSILLSDDETILYEYNAKAAIQKVSTCPHNDHNTVRRWEKLTKTQKTTYLKILVSEIKEETGDVSGSDDR